MRHRLYLSCLLLGAAVPASAQPEKEPAPYVLVFGEGEVRAKPDRVVLNFGIQSSAKEIKAAQTDNSRKTGALLSALRKQGIAEKDVQTTMVQVHPRYDYIDGKQRFMEYVALKNFTVRIDDVEKYGSVLQAVLNAGVNQVGGVEYEHSRRKELEEEALKRAVQDARKKAGLVAAADGRKAGAAVAIEAGSVGHQPPPMPFRANMALQSKMEADAGDQVAAGEIAIRAGVSARFRLE